MKNISALQYITIHFQIKKYPSPVVGSVFIYDLLYVKMTFEIGNCAHWINLYFENEQISWNIGNVIENYVNFVTAWY